MKTTERRLSAFKIFAAAILFLVSLAMPDLSQTAGKFSPESLKVRKPVCSKIKELPSLDRCLSRQLRALESNLRDVRARATEAIEGYYDNQSNQEKSSHEIELVSWFKEGFEETQIAWMKFRKAECSALASFRKNETKRIRTLRCLISQDSERLFELHYTYFGNEEDKAAPQSGNSLPPHPCDKKVGGGTLEIIECESLRLKASEKKLNGLLGKVKNRISEKNFTKLLHAQKAWAAYRDSAGSTYGILEAGGGTASGPLALVTKTIETEARIKTIEETYLGKK